MFPRNIAHQLVLQHIHILLLTTVPPSDTGMRDHRDPVPLTELHQRLLWQVRVGFDLVDDRLDRAERQQVR